MSLVQDAEAFNTAITDDAPEMEDPPPTTVTLLRGVPDNGVWHTTEVVRELTGEDEETLASIDVGKDSNLSFGEYISEILSLGVVSIGPIESPSKEILDELMLGDRELLFLGIVRATYGREREYTVTCPKCEQENFITVDLDSDFPITPSAWDLHSPHHIEIKNGTVAVNLPNGKASHAVSKAKTTAEQNTLLIANCLVGGTVEFARKLSMADRNKLVKTLLDNQPGPTLEEVKAPCGHCSTEITMVLDWASLLFG
jgi:hypothetical protein